MLKKRKKRISLKKATFKKQKRVTKNLKVIFSISYFFYKPLPLLIFNTYVVKDTLCDTRESGTQPGGATSINKNILSHLYSSNSIK